MRKQFPFDSGRREEAQPGLQPPQPGFPLPQCPRADAPPPAPPLRPRKQRVWLHVLLFILTAASTSFMVGPLYSLCLMSILTAHEFGHYFAARRHGVAASLPYFLPAPFLMGTMGAVIRMSPYVPNRRALFDIAAAGPLAGMALAAPLSFIGVLLSERVSAAENQVGLILGDPLLFQLFERAVFGPAAPGEILLLHNVGFAGWVGLFVTALNLLPIGQLDGGHISYAVFGRRSLLYAKLACGGLLLVTLTISLNYAFFLVVMFALGIKHPPTMNDAVALDPLRRKIGWLLAATFFVCFTPTPFAF